MPPRKAGRPASLSRCKAGQGREADSAAHPLRLPELCPAVDENDKAQASIRRKTLPTSVCFTPRLRPFRQGAGSFDPGDLSARTQREIVAAKHSLRVQIIRNEGHISVAGEEFSKLLAGLQVQRLIV